MKRAIIVESPTKTRTLERFLGDGYTLLASSGHVRDLPKDGIAVDVEHGFAPQYETIPAQAKRLSELKKALKGMDEVYLAMDPDREGEAIAWHLVEALGLKDARRIEFNEITKDAVVRALEHPGTIDMSRVNAYQARRILDRLVGYKLSPVLWSRIGSRGKEGALSAGRVQSAALRLICDREREIAAFDPDEYWSIEVLLSTGDEAGQFTAQLKTRGGEDVELKTEADVLPIVEELRQARFVVGDISSKRTRRAPQPPLRTSTLQRAAASQLHFAAKKTMRVAQQLYEGVETADGIVGLITYMRTDSTRVSAEAQGQARAFITDQFGEKFIGPGAKGKARKGVQDAHEAIRPTDALRTPEAMKPFLDKDQAKLYEVIWRQFIASQMAAAEFEEIGVEIAAGEYTLRAGGSVLVFAGYLAVLPQERDEAETRLLRHLAEGQELELVEVLPEQHFTKPPPRYTEASLVRALEDNGIGRPSTYAPTIDTLRRRKYVRMQQRAFVPTVVGFVVNDFLVANFPGIVNIEFTAQVEAQLDSVQSGEIEWQELLEKFYAEFAPKIEAAAKAEPRVFEGAVCAKCGGRLLERYFLHGEFAGCENYPDCDYTLNLLADVIPEKKTEPVGRDCPECDKPLVYRVNWREQKFIGCSGYPDCKYTENLGPDGEPVPAAEETDIECEQCGGKMVIRQGRRGPFLGCSNYPKCRNTKPLETPGDGDGAAAEAGSGESLDLVCEKCGAPMVVKTGRRGPFVACSGYPKCKNTKPMSAAYDAGYKKAEAESVRSEPEPLGEDCPECGKALLIRSGRRGPFVACSGYPKCRYTRDVDAGEDEAE